MSENRSNQITVHARMINVMVNGKKKEELAGVFQKCDFQFGILPFEFEYLVIELSTGTEVLHIPKCCSGMFDVDSWNIHLDEQEMEHNKKVLERTLLYPLNERIEL